MLGVSITCRNFPSIDFSAFLKSIGMLKHLGTSESIFNSRCITIDRIQFLDKIYKANNTTMQMT